jgi:hypothetical protein
LLKVDAPRPPLAERPQFPDQIGGGRHGGFVPEAAVKFAGSDRGSLSVDDDDQARKIG